jgi:26S proteasome regulatory subunit N7
MAPIYQHCCKILNQPCDEAKLSAMTITNNQTLAELEEKIKDAETNHGEQEIRDALLAKAEHLASIGDRDGASSAFAATEAKTAGSGPKMDLVFTQLRLLMFYEDWPSVKKMIAKAKQLSDAGGDWERRNKLKVYEAVFACYTREFKLAADLFLEALATFSATELFPYSRVIFYGVITAIPSYDRVALKKKVLDAPEVLTSINQLPFLEPYLNSLYACKYADFFQAFVEIANQMGSDPFLAPHVNFYMREVRIVAYAQFLESYKSVTLDSMASAFHVTSDFLDQELSNFIVAGRLNARIDKVSGVVVTNRPDHKNALYQDMIKKGDHLLNRVQGLANIAGN